MAERRETIPYSVSGPPSHAPILPVPTLSLFHFLSKLLSAGEHSGSGATKFVRMDVLTAGFAIKGELGLTLDGFVVWFTQRLYYTMIFILPPLVKLLNKSRSPVDTAVNHSWRARRSCPATRTVVRKIYIANVNAHISRRDSTARIDMLLDGAHCCLINING